MGGILLGNYLWRAGDETPLNAAILYSVPWNLEKGAQFFLKKWFYSKVLFWNLNRIMAEQLRHMRKCLTNEEYRRLETVFKNNWEGILTLDDQIFVPQYKFKDKTDYWQNISINYKNRVSKIKIPTFALSAKDDLMCDPIFTPRQNVCGGKGSMLIS